MNQMIGYYRLKEKFYGFIEAKLQQLFDIILLYQRSNKGGVFTTRMTLGEANRERKALEKIVRGGYMLGRGREGGGFPTPRYDVY